MCTFPYRYLFKKEWEGGDRSLWGCMDVYVYATQRGYITKFKKLLPHIYHPLNHPNISHLFTFSKSSNGISTSNFVFWSI